LLTIPSFLLLFFFTTLVGEGAWEKLINKQVDAAPAKKADSKVLEIDVKNATVELKSQSPAQPAQPAQPAKPLEDTWTYVEVQNQLPGISKLQPQVPPQPQPQPATVMPQQLIPPQQLPQFVPSQQYNNIFQPPQPYGGPVYSPFMAQQQQVGSYVTAPSPVPFGSPRPAVQQAPPQQQQPQHYYYPQTQQQSPAKPPQGMQQPQQPQQPQQQFAPMYQAPPQQQQPQLQYPQQQLPQPHPPHIAKAISQLREMGVTINPHVEELAKKHNGDIAKIFHDMYSVNNK